VFFDNLAVQYKQGPLLEENHYYPYGLTMAGISDKAVKTRYAENKYRFNDGTELQNKEFSDGTGLETYATDNRMYDCQLGRFWQIDPDADGTEDFSPYAFANDNPILLNDPMGSDTAHYGDNAYVTAVTKSTPSGPDVAAAAGPAPTSVADPIQSSAAVTEDPSSDAPSSTATFEITLIALGEGAGEVTVTGLGSVPVAVGVAVGIGLMGLQEWSRPKNYHEPTHVPTGDISIGIPRPYIPIFHASAGGGGTGITAPCPYPQNPALPPIPGWQWKGKAGSAPGSSEGNWVNPNNKKEYLRPDVDHPDPIGPHWDWKAPDGKEYRYYPDGRLEPKTK